MRRAASARAARAASGTVAAAHSRLGDPQLVRPELHAVEALGELDQRRVAPAPDLLDDRGDPRDRRPDRWSPRAAGERRDDAVRADAPPSRRSRITAAPPRAARPPAGSTARCAVFWAARLTIKRAVDRRISATSTSPLARSVSPDCTRSTMRSASPTSGASSIEPSSRTTSTWMPALGEVPPREVGILGRHAHPRPLRRVVALPELPGLRDHEPADAEPEIERLVDVRLLLQQDVLADDADVGRAVLDVGRDVQRA